MTINEYQTETLHMPLDKKNPEYARSKADYLIDIQLLLSDLEGTTIPGKLLDEANNIIEKPHHLNINNFNRVYYQLRTVAQQE